MKLYTVTDNHYGHVTCFTSRVPALEYAYSRAASIYPHEPPISVTEVVINKADRAFVMSAIEGNIRYDQVTIIRTYRGRKIDC